MRLRRRVGAALRAFKGPAMGLEEPTRVVIDRLLAGKNALITGAGKNIGRSIALEMAAHGANVYCTDADADQCAAMEAELGRLPCKSRVFHSNIAKEGDNEEVCRALARDGVLVEILVNNVGIHAADMPTAFGANVFGPVHLTRLISQAMIEQKTPGSIIFLSSIHQDSIRRLMAYSASKAAIKMIISELAIELAPHGIRVNGIAPGYVTEDGLGRAIPHKYAPLEGSSVSPRYVGRAAVYLASEYFSRYTTGEILKIDAGLSLFNYLSAIDAGL